MSSSELRNESFGGEMEATLEQLLAHRSAVVLGEPGSGKSTVARVAVERTTARGWVPLFGSLQSYTGDIAQLLVNDAPVELVVGEAVDGVRPIRVLILDGLDEIRQEQLHRFIEDLSELLHQDEHLRVLLTARQAFYAANLSLFGNQPQAFYLLDFNENNIRQCVEHSGDDYTAFMEEINRVELEQEVANPFALQVLLRAFREGHSLGQLRHEAVGQVVESLILSRPGIAADRQRRALRMLAVAMEAASRNELTRDECVRLLRTATTLSADTAEAVLNDLTGSILVSTANGIAFQMRSYGEYLAAVELSDKALDRVLLLVRYQKTMLPNESWRNCISYLAELNAGVKHHFSVAHPNWMTVVSPAAFAEKERTALLSRVLNQLADDRRYLWRHPSLSIQKIKNFVTPNILRQLTVDAAGPDVVKRANALVLLGVTRATRVIELALPIATDQTCPQMLRGSAIAALANADDATVIPTSIEVLDEEDPLYLSLMDCIGSLTDVASIPHVLPLLVRSDALISGGFHRFRELKTPEAVDQLLEVLTADSELIHASRLDSYVQPLWEAMEEWWQARWAEPMAGLIVRWEASYTGGRDLRTVEKVLRRLGTRAEELVHLVLKGLLAADTRLLTFRSTIASIVTPRVAEWLAEQPDATNLMQTIALLGTPEVRAVLAPHLADFMEAQAEAKSQYRYENQVLNDRARVHLERSRASIRTSHSILEVLGRLSELEAKEWPDVSPERTAWFREQVEQSLHKCQPAVTTIWHDENSLTYQNVLPLLVRMVDRYALTLEDDVPLLQSLLALESHHVVACHRRHPFSVHAIAECERLVGDPQTPTGALYNILDFLRQTELSTGPINNALVVISEDTRRPDGLRSWAIQCCASSASEQQLVELASRLPGSWKETVEQELIDRQHRPTIEKRLANLVGNPDALCAGNVEFPDSSPLEWIGKIKNADVWPKLDQLRLEALRLGLPRMTALLTDTMQQIDGLALATTIREQIPFAPLEWQERQGLQAFEIERDTHLHNAQTTPFDEILRRLRRVTSLGLFKIWCEGPTDAPTIQAFVDKLPETTRLDVVTDSLKGWTTVMNPAWVADRLADGCHDLIVLLDGDKARDWTRAGIHLGQLHSEYSTSSWLQVLQPWFLSGTALKTTLRRLPVSRF